MTEALNDRFWSKVNKDNDCWVWTGRVNDLGYGWFDIREGGRSRGRLAHRVSWLLTYGPIPHGMSVLHRCDRPRCVRPEHLFIGTQADNIADMDANGRRGSFDRSGESNGNSKLSISDVQAIRQEYANGNVTLCSIAANYGVASSTISGIVRGKRWPVEEARRRGIRVDLHGPKGLVS